MRNGKPVITVAGLCGDSVFMRVDHFHRSGETLHAQSLYSEPGGKGANQAVAAARLGADVGFVSCMGRDGIESSCADFLRREGLRLYTQYTDKCASSYACILTDSKGENRATVHRGSAAYLSAEFISTLENEIAASDILLLNNETPFEANLRALEFAEKHSVPAILNPAPYSELDCGYLRRFYLLTPNRQEAAALLNTDADTPAEELLRSFARLGISRCVITLGEEGCAAYDGEGLYRCPAVKTAALDTTGAGDCFNAALAVRLAEGATLPEALEYASNASAYSVGRMYVMPSLPHKDELELIK